MGEEGREKVEAREVECVLNTSWVLISRAM